MRRDILHPGAGKLKYEIREIVGFARSLGKWNIPIHWENIGDPVQKGEPVADWIKDIVREKAGENLSYAYSETEGVRSTREFLSGLANRRPVIETPGTNPQTAPRPSMKGINTTGQALYPPDHLQVVRPSAASSGVLNPSVPHSLNHVRASTDAISLHSSIKAEDVLFFNGLGDAVAKVFGFLRREARVLGPSPAYSTLSSAEAAHSGYEHLTYRLDPQRDWMPDMNDVELKVKYNDSIAGILLINPDNPTGAVYPVEVLLEFVRIARNYGLFIICDETYANIVYGGAKTAALSQVIGDVPGLALRSISKEVPWPGARCGWAEIYNRKADPRFDAYIKSLLDSKRLEVCSTSLPQLCIPAIMGDPRYGKHLETRAAMFEKRADEMEKAFAGVSGILMKKPSGAFYVSAVFDNVLNENSDSRSLPVSDESLRDYIRAEIAGLKPDKQFVYWLLASTGICVVPLSGFATDLPGFRFTLLEHDDEKRKWIFNTLAEAVRNYLR